MRPKRDKILPAPVLAYPATRRLPTIVALPDGTELHLGRDFYLLSEVKRRLAHLSETEFDRVNDANAGGFVPYQLPLITAIKKPAGRLLKIETTRKCKKCSGLVLPGERRCRCHTVEAKVQPAKQGSREAAHFYHLFKSMRTGDWSKTGYRAAHSAFRSEIRLLAADGEGREYRIHSPHGRWWTAAAIEFFIYRCELARHYWRDEFAALMGTRMELLAAGYQQKKVCDFLGIPRKSLLWLDREIKKFGVRFPGRPVVIREEYDRLRRRMKNGVAAGIIRRRQHGYKQSQSLSYQPVNPFNNKIGTTYEGGTTDATAN